MLDGNILITGGAGFIGSYLVDRLLDNTEGDYQQVHVLDNLSTGSIDHVHRWNDNQRFQFFRLDLVSDAIDELAGNDYSTVFHLAANPDVRSSSINPKLHLEQNVLATFNILEYARKHDISMFVFTSSSTVYGEPGVIPTPEDTPLNPISMYGATKAACEAMVCSYANMYGFKAVIYRLANVIGARSTHGVIYDFMRKLTANGSVLEILGNGRQRKSYIHVSDCIEAMLTGLNGNGRVGIFNVGSDDYIEVIEIADIVAKAINLHNVRYVFTDGNGDGRGWRGDVRVMLLDTGRLKALGWRARYSSREAVEETVRGMITERLQERV
ncbi:MAG: NAD-dependent epimerase/dehydratase family protein [Candidatus Nitrosocaldus sp.]|nr:NAD-dependent epimerase/dehydratase family protein [Candidatus Nitrosocaldus sp.]MDW8276113.1 NAD-dependent epimerase/dehydratase family protein [Candidatus Nitrosocaldus sp.]